MTNRRETDEYDVGARFGKDRSEQTGEQVPKVTIIAGPSFVLRDEHCRRRGDRVSFRHRVVAQRPGESRQPTAKIVNPQRSREVVAERDPCLAIDFWHVFYR